MTRDDEQFLENFIGVLQGLDRHLRQRENLDPEIGEQLRKAAEVAQKQLNDVLVS